LIPLHIGHLAAGPSVIMASNFRLQLSYASSAMEQESLRCCILQGFSECILFCGQVPFQGPTHTASMMNGLAAQLMQHSKQRYVAVYHCSLIHYIRGAMQEGDIDLYLLHMRTNFDLSLFHGGSPLPSCLAPPIVKRSPF